MKLQVFAVTQKCLLTEEKTRKFDLCKSLLGWQSSHLAALRSLSRISPLTEVCKNLWTPVRSRNEEFGTRKLGTAAWHCAMGHLEFQVFSISWSMITKAACNPMTLQVPHRLKEWNQESFCVCIKGGRFSWKWSKPDCEGNAVPKMKVDTWKQPPRHFISVFLYLLSLVFQFLNVLVYSWGNYSNPLQFAASER